MSVRIEAVLLLCLMGLDVFCPTGEQLFLHCKAFANCGADEALIYWLVNDTFPEDTHSNDRIVELEE